MKKSISLLALAAVALPAIAPALSFSFTTSGSVPTNVQNAFAAAGQRWSNIFSDNITVNIEIGWQNLGGSVLGGTSSAMGTVSYNSFSTQMNADKTSANDMTAVANLPVGSMSFLTNRTTQNGNSSSVYLDNNGSANNTNISMTSANAKALGYNVGSGLDANITFNSSFGYDFDPSNGISGGLIDFVGIATHEIGHAMGFVSAVDILDANPGFSEDSFRLNPLDVFRYSNRNGFGVQRDFAADNQAKFFSFDGGATLGARFANGVSFGDGDQASHWRDNSGLGIMDPTAGSGELLAIGANDIQAFDVIGWDLQAVPEPFTMVGLGVAALAIARRKRKNS